MRDRETDGRAEAVSAHRTTRGAEGGARWAWTEPTIWTERRLTALDEGVKGGKWYSVMDKVYRRANLRVAFAKVQANGGAAGVDRQTTELVAQHLEATLQRLEEELKAEQYRPQAVRRAWIPKSGKSKEQRPLGIPTVRDRVVQTARRKALEPLFERDFAAQSYGVRPPRGCKEARRRVEERLTEGHTWVVDAALRSSFDTIPRQPLLERVKTKVSDGTVLALIAASLEQGVLEDGKHWSPAAGPPQGAVISPLLSNIYRDPLDHRMEGEGFQVVRYADDFVILCRREEEAQRALEGVRQWTAAAGLSLHPEKTHIVDATLPGGVDFLGYHFERGYRWPRKKSVEKRKAAVRRKTRRTNGQSLKVIIEGVNQTLMGWFEYFKHSHRTTCPRLDGWIRLRVRSILRNRTGRRGRGRGLDQQRWTNTFCAEQGLFCLTTAHVPARQSSRR